MHKELWVYRRKMAAHLHDPQNHPRPRLPKMVSEKMSEIGAKGGSAKGDAKRRSPEHYLKMALAKRRKRLGW
jgi:hypothetical protein